MKPMPDKNGMTYKQKFEVLCEFIRDTERAVGGEAERLNSMYVIEPDECKAELLLHKLTTNQSTMRVVRDMARFAGNIDAIDIID